MIVKTDNSSIIFYLGVWMAQVVFFSFCQWYILLKYQVITYWVEVLRKED